MPASTAKPQDIHVREITMTSVLSGQQVMNAIPLEAILKKLNAHKIRYVLAGAHGHAGWRREPRATQDVDLVVMAKHVKKATRLLTDAFPDLVADDQEVVVRLRHRGTGDVTIDLMKTNQPLYRATFQHATPTVVQGQACLVPVLEMALAMKFAAMISIVREDHKKYMDASDFIRMVKVNPNIDFEVLAELGDLVYPDGGKEIVERVEQARTGKRLEL